MRLARLALLTIPMFAIGATCVTHVEQRGPAGPWVGEVVNYRAEPVNSVMVRARLYDATGKDLGYWNIETCPGSLGPGERGVFELFFPIDYLPQPQLPLRAEFAPIAEAYSGELALVGEGLSTELVATNTERRYALVRITNDSPWSRPRIAVKTRRCSLRGES